jgi:hypothetical protein
MHPLFSETMIRAHERELDRYGRSAHTLRGARRKAAGQEPSVTIRLARPQDAEALAQLAQLEGRPEAEATYLVAEVAGSIVAALPLAGGEPLADPFRRTAHLVPLLELRAKQLTSTPPRRKPIAFLGAIRGWSRV